MWWAFLTGLAFGLTIGIAVPVGFSLWFWRDF
jgi:hypothetical protein